MNEQGTTPLFHAVWAGKRSIAQYLAEHGADINLSKEGGWKPIHASTYNAFEKMTTYLVEHKAALSAPCTDIKDYSPLHVSECSVVA